MSLSKAANMVIDQTNVGRSIVNEGKDNYGFLLRGMVAISLKSLNMFFIEETWNTMLNFVFFKDGKIVSYSLSPLTD